MIQFSLPQAVPCIRLVSSDDVAPSIEPQKLGSSPLDTPSISNKFYQPQRPQRPQRPRLSSLTHRLCNALTGFDTDERHLLPQLHASNFRDMPRPFNIFSTSALKIRPPEMQVSGKQHQPTAPAWSLVT